MEMRPFLLAALVAAAQVAAAEPLESVVRTRLAESETPSCVAVGFIGSATGTAFACSEGAGPLTIDANSLFEIGSITKGLTGLILADMVRKGEVKLEDPASKYSRPGAKLPTRGGREITLRDLVTHTSGLPRMPPGFAPTNWRDPYADFDADALYRALEKTELQRDIGLSSEYSNFGFMWLSEILSRRAGKTYDELLAERVLVPLGMTSTAIKLDPALAARLTTGHNTQYEPVPPWHVGQNLAGVGAVRSSLSDMLRLAEALAGIRSTPLDETIELALKPLHRLGNLESHIGYAWFMKDRTGTRVHNHGGGTAGFATMIAFDRNKKTAAVVLADASSRADDLALHLVDPVWPLLRKRVALPLDAATRKQYVGSYELRPGFVITVWEEGEKLMSRATGQSAVEYFRDGTDAFFLRVVDARIVFNRGKDGNVEGLTLHQNGRQVPGRRLPEAK
jgi:D-alanyl-D-alanine-carboxypeptidase/D-alanyl-D-alanine-endopeptidase